MAGFRNIGDDQGPVAEINITPLVDVMLVLLVIFMVTAPMLESGIAIQLPRASAKALPKGEETPVTLNLTKESRVYINKEEIALNDLRAQLQVFFRGRSKREIFIRADGSLPYAFVAQTMATVKSAGITKIGLVTLPPESQATK
jgi:biopolymer transport protein TolR